MYFLFLKNKINKALFLVEICFREEEAYLYKSVMFPFCINTSLNMFRALLQSQLHTFQGNLFNIQMTNNYNFIQITTQTQHRLQQKNILFPFLKTCNYQPCCSSIHLLIYLVLFFLPFDISYGS